MMKIRQSRGFAGVLIATMVVALFFAANHCALAAIESLRKRDTKHACCHSDQGAPQPFATQCCTALAAPIPQVAVAPALHLHELHPAWIQAPRFETPVEVSIAVIFNTGPPPGCTSFAVRVLNRSLLAHAPPRVVA